MNHEQVSPSFRLLAVSRLLAYWAPPVVYAGMIFFVSGLSHPEEELPSFLSGISDKVLHLVEYGGLSLLCYRAFRWAAGEWGAAHALWLAIVTATVYGLSDELHQVFVPPREADPWDLTADALGALLGAVGWRRMTEP
ncbi:MAG TPA: VanZ family protein [Nitrospiraceae bacterium]|nr:VanZ family protein [Nitrospiraceae bacterium]